MERTLLRMLAAATAAAALSSCFTITAAAQSDQPPTHAELVQRWAEAAIDAQLKGMKTSLRLTADQEKDWASFESAVKAAEKARVVALQKEQGSNLSPMDRNTAKAERQRRAKPISRRSSKRPSPCMRASMTRRNTSSSRLDACWCLSAGNLRRR